MPSDGPEVHRRLAPELTTVELHGLLRLRTDVFVVEQQCPYPELDGRDLEPTTEHWWIGDGADPLTCLRVLVDPDDSRHIGRVVTSPAARRRGLAGRLLREALAVVPPPVHLKAQAHLTDWYASFGFVVAGDQFVEDGIPHAPMILRT